MQGPKSQKSQQEFQKPVDTIEQQEQKTKIELPIQAQDLQKNNIETQTMAKKTIDSDLKKLQTMEKVNPHHDS